MHACTTGRTTLRPSAQRSGNKQGKNSRLPPTACPRPAWFAWHACPYACQDLCRQPLARLRAKRNSLTMGRILCCLTHAGTMGSVAFFLFFLSYFSLPQLGVGFPLALSAHFSSRQSQCRITIAVNECTELHVKVASSDLGGSARGYPR